MGEDLEEKLDKINNYQNFVKYIASHVTNFRFINNGKDLTMFMTDTLGKKVVQFLHFREVDIYNSYWQKKMDLKCPTTNLIYKRIPFYINGHS